MPRKRRHETDEGYAHVTAKAVDKLDLFRDNRERELFLLILGRVVEKFALVVHTYVLMTNHYHLLVATPRANLGAAMEALNGNYGMWMNRIRERRGRVFAARYNPIEIVDEAHLQEVLRYVALNPVRAGMCERAEDWPWSAHRALAGLTRAPRLLDTRLLGLFHHEPVNAQAAYARFVAAGSPYASIEGILALTPTPAPQAA